MNLKLTHQQLQSIINKLLVRINKLDFVIIPTIKNKRFMQEYMLNKTRAKELVLSKISQENFVSYEFDRDLNNYGVGYVMIFIYDCELKNYSNQMRKIQIYVKIKDVDDSLPVLSMHESKGE